MSSVLRLQFWHPDVCSHGIRMDCYTAVRAALEALPSPRFPRSCRRLLPFFGVVSCRIGIGQCFLPFLTLAGVQKERFFLCGGLTGIRINCFWFCLTPMNRAWSFEAGVRHIDTVGHSGLKSWEVQDADKCDLTRLVDIYLCTLTWSVHISLSKTMH